MSFDSGEKHSPVLSRRRWLQFSLRTLMVVTIVIGLGLGWFASRLEKARRQADAVAGLRRAGANVFYEHELAERHRETNADGTWNPDWREEIEPPGPGWLREWRSRSARREPGCGTWPA